MLGFDARDYRHLQGRTEHDSRSKSTAHATHLDTDTTSHDTNIARDHLHGALVVLELNAPPGARRLRASGDLDRTTMRVAIRFSILVASGLVLCLTPFLARWVLLVVQILSAQGVGRCTSRATDWSHVDVVVHPGWWVWFRAAARRAPVEWALGSDRTGWMRGIFVSDVGGWEMPRWIGMLSVACLTLYGACFSYQFRRRRLHQAECSTSIGAALPQISTIVRSTRRMMVACCGASAAWCFLRQAATYASYFRVGSPVQIDGVSSFVQGVVHLFGWIELLLMFDRPSIMLGMGLVAFAISSRSMSRRVVARICRERGRACPMCAYLLVRRGWPCPECGKHEAGLVRRRRCSPRVQKRASRLLIAAVVIASLEASAYIGVSYVLVRIRLSPWWLRSVDGRSAEVVEEAQLRAPALVAIVRIGTSYSMNCSGQAWRVVFSETPLKSVGCTITDSLGDSKDFEFDASPLTQPRPLAVVLVGGVKMLMTPRHDFELPDDLPPGWIALRIYKAGVTIEAVSSEAPASTAPAP